MPVTQVLELQAFAVLAFSAPFEVCFLFFIDAFSFLARVFQNNIGSSFTSGRLPALCSFSPSSVEISHHHVSEGCWVLVLLNKYLFIQS